MTVAAFQLIDVNRSKVQEAQNVLDEATVELRCSVKAAKDAGATWQQIGDAFGVTRSAACERFKTK